MKVLIEYCTTCNYRPIAATIARKIEQKIGLKTDLSPSNVPGALEIIVNGRKVFSKAKTGRFPDVDALISDLKGEVSSDGD